MTIALWASAISAVASLEPESTTTISSANRTLSSAAASERSALSVISVTERGARVLDNGERPLRE